MRKRTTIAAQLIACAVISAAEVRAAPESATWTVSCLPELQLCLATTDTLVLFLDDENKPHLLLKGPQPYRVSVLTGRRSHDLPQLTQRALTQNEIDLVDRAGAQIILEWVETPPKVVRCDGIQKALGILRWLLHAPTPSDQVSSTAPYLQRYYEVQSVFEAPAAVFLPATKPQVQFALRAQSGQSPPVINGYGSKSD